MGVMFLPTDEGRLRVAVADSIVRVVVVIPIGIICFLQTLERIVDIIDGYGRGLLQQRHGRQHKFWLIGDGLEESIALCKFGRVVYCRARRQ